MVKEWIIELFFWKKYRVGKEYSILFLLNSFDLFLLLEKMYPTCCSYRKFYLHDDFGDSFDKPVAEGICGLLGLLKPITFTLSPRFYFS